MYRGRSSLSESTWGFVGRGGIREIWALPLVAADDGTAGHAIGPGECDAHVVEAATGEVASPGDEALEHSALGAVQPS